MAKGFVSVSELLKHLQEQNSGFLNGDYFQFDNINGANGMLSGRAPKEIEEFNALSAKAKKKGLTVEKLFMQLEAVARGHGLQVVAAPSGRGDNTYNIIYVPANDPIYNAENIANGDNSAREFAQSLPQFTFSGIDAEGLISVNGQKTINQGMIDIEGEEIVYYTMMEKLLREQLNKFNTGKRGQNTSFLRNIDRMTNSSLDATIRQKATRAAKGSVKYTTKNVMNGGVATSNFQGLLDEYNKALQGIGSRASKDVRKGYVNMKPLIDALLEEDWDVIRSYQKQNNGVGSTTINGSKEQIEKDLMTILSLYAQATDVSNIEEELNAFGGGKYRYLKGSATIKRLRNFGNILNKVRPDIGTSQEGSISNFLMSFVRNQDIGLLGGLDDKGNRKRLQVANVLQRMPKARESLKGMSSSGANGIKTKKLYTQHERNNKLFGDDTDFEYVTGFASEEEIRKAGEAVYEEILAKLKKTNQTQEKPLSKQELERLAKSRAGLIGGAHSGGIFYSSDIKSTLDSEQFRTMSVTEEDFKREVNKILTAAAKRKETMTEAAARHQAALNFVRDKFGISSSDPLDNEDDRSIDISDVLSYGGEKHRVLSVIQKKLMRDGVKLMGLSDFSMKGTGVELDQRVIDKIYENRGLDGSDVRFIRNPEALDIRSLSGILEGYVRQVFGAMSDKQIKDSLENEDSGILKDWLTLDSDTQKWVLNNNIFDRNRGIDEKTLLTFVDDLNGLRDNLFKNVFSTDGGKLSVDFNRLKIATSVSQFAGYDYGAPGGRNLNVDYRFKGAVDRGLTAASMGTKTDLSVLSRYLLGKNTQKHVGGVSWSPEVINDKFVSPGLYNGDAKDQEKYISWLKQLEHITELNKWSRDRQKEYGISDILKNKDLVLGYGNFDNFLSNYGIKDFKEFVGAQYSGLSAVELEAKTKEIYDALSERYIDLSDEKHGISTVLEYKDGHITAESWAESFGKLQESQGKIGANGRTIFAPSNGGFYAQSGNKAVGGSFLAIPDLNMFDKDIESVDEDGNKRYDLPSVFKTISNLISAERYLQEQRDLQTSHDPSFRQETYDRAEEGLSEAIVEAIAAFSSEVESKNGSLWQKANKVAIGHSMFGSAVAGPTYDRASAPNIDNEIQRRIDDVGITISTEDAEKLLGMGEGDKASLYLKALRANYHYLYDEVKSYREVEADIENLLKDASTDDASTDKEKVDILLQKLIESNTIGSTEFMTRLKDTRKKGGTFRGLGGQFLRFPLSNGLDTQNSEIFFDSSMAKGEMRAGLGIGHGVNLDFDGDKILFNLELTSGELLNQMGSDTIQRLLFEKKTAVDFQNNINSAIALSTAREMLAGTSAEDSLYFDKTTKSLKSILPQEDLKKIFNTQAQETASILSRLNKGYTGLLSNNYQAITEVLAANSAHSDNVPLNNNVAKEDFVRDMITRGVFEGFTQDAISSKKVVKRISDSSEKNGISDWSNNTEFFVELDRLMGLFKDQKTYDSEENLLKAFEQAINMGIFKKDDMFADRITSRIFATAQKLYTDDHGVVDIKGLATALRMSEDKVKPMLYSFDEKGNAIGGGEGGFDLQTVVKTVIEADRDMRIRAGQGLGTIQQRKAFNIPGGFNAASNPVYRLGEDLYTQEDLDRLSAVDPALARLISKYGTLQEAAEGAAKALTVEAQAEENKIGIANSESKAIASGTNAYKDRMDVLRRLGSIKEDAYDVSVSGVLNEIFGNTYGDTKPFADAMVKKYDELVARGDIDLSEGVTPNLLRYGGSVGEERYKSFSRGYWAPVEGKIADSLEQILTETNQLLFKKNPNDKHIGTINTYDDLKRFLDDTAGNAYYRDIQKVVRSSLISGVKGAEGVDFLLGKAQYNRKPEDYLQKDARGLYSVGGIDYTDINEAFAALKEANEINGKMFHASFGDNADRFREHYLTLGRAQFAATMAAARGDLGNIGSGEQELIYSPDGKKTIHGRADRIIYGKRTAGDEDLFGEQTTYDQETISVFDKKIANKINPRYIAQVMEYILMLQQIQDVITKSQGTNKPIKTLEDFMSSDLGQIYSRQYGDKPISEELFSKLAGGAAINGGLLVTDEKGHNTRYDIGFNGRSGQFNLTGNREIDAVIMSYLKNGVSYDSWDEAYKTAFTQSAKINPSGEGNFESQLTREEKAFADYKAAWVEYYKILKEVNDLTINKNKAEASGNAGAVKDLQILIELRKKELLQREQEKERLLDQISTKSEVDENGEKKTVRHFENNAIKEYYENNLDSVELLRTSGLHENAQQYYEKTLQSYNSFRKIYDNLYKQLFTDLEVQIKETELAGGDTSELLEKKNKNQTSEAWVAAEAELEKRANVVNQYAAALREHLPEFETQTIDVAQHRADLAGGTQAAVEAAQEKAFSGGRSQYVKYRKEKTNYLKQLDFYERALADSESPLSDELREEYEETVKTIKENILKTIEQELQNIETMFGKTVSDDGTVSFNDNKFSELYTRVEAEQGIREQRNKELGQERYERGRRVTDERNSREAYAAYNTLNERNLALLKNEQAMSKTNDEISLSFLKEERVALEELLQLAQDTVSALEEAHKGNGLGGGDSAEDIYWQKILSGAKRKSDLEYQVKKNDFLSRNKNNGKEFGGLFPSIGKQFAGYFSRFLGGMLVYRIMGKLKQGISSLVKDAEALNVSLTNLRITTGGTASDTRNLISNYAQLGREIGATTQEIASSALEWQRQGYDAAEVTDLITSSLYLSKLGMIDSATATKDLTSALKGFKLQASESMDVVDKLTAIDLKAATSAGEIAEGLAQFANIGSLSGVDIDKAASYVATIADVTQMSGSSAGQALKTIISRYGNVKAGAYNKLTFNSDVESNEALNDVERVLKKLGISIRDSNLSFKSFDAVLGEIADKWKSLDNVSQKAISNAFAGVRQQEAFTTLMQNWDKYEELLEVSQNSKGTAEKKFDAYKDSLQASKNAFKTTWEELVNNAQISEFLKKVYDIGTWLGKITPLLIKFLPQFIIAIEQIKTLAGGESFIQKGFGWLNKIGAFEKGGIRNLFFGPSLKAKASGGDYFGAGKNIFTKDGWNRIKSIFRKKDARDQKAAAIKQQERQESAWDRQTENREKIITPSQNHSVILSPQQPSGRAPSNGALRGGSGAATTIRDPYEQSYRVLGVKPDSSLEDIRIAYGKLARQYHPDTVSDGGNTEQFQIVTEACNNLRTKFTPQPTQQNTVQPNQLMLTTQMQQQNLTQLNQTAQVGGNKNSPSTAPTQNASLPAGYKYDKNGRLHGPDGKFASAPPPSATQEAQPSSGMSKGGSQGGAVGKIKAGAAVASYAAGQLAAGVTAYETGGLTHTYNGQTVNSSERAHKSARAAEVAFSASVPIIGSVIGHLVGGAIAKNIDAERDRINEATEKAQKRLSVLNSTTGDINKMSSLASSMKAEDVQARQEASDSLVNEMYKSENTETRQMLQKYLSDIYGEQVTLRDVMEDYNSNNVKSRERAAKALEIAQKKARNEEEVKTRGNELYNYQQNVDKQMLKYNASRDGYEKNGITSSERAGNVLGTIGAGAGTSVAVAGGAAATGLLTAAAISASVPIWGWVAGAILALGAGVMTGIAAFKAQESEDEEKNARKWDELSLDEKIDLLSDKVNGTTEIIGENGEITQQETKGLKEQIAEMDAAMARGEEVDVDQLNTLEKQLAVTEDTLATLRDYRSYLQSLVDKDNQMAIEEGLLRAGVTVKGEIANSKTGVKEMGNYLMDMNISQLKDLGAEEIYRILAGAIDEDALTDMAIFTKDADGNEVISQQFIEMAETILKSDEEIAAVLSGESYTLSDVYTKILLDENGQQKSLKDIDQFDKQVLQNFADALGITVEEIGNYVDTLGTLSLSDLLKTTRELIDSVEEYSSLLGSVIDGTHSSSDWMSEIVSKFPDLISYMSDTPTLIGKLVEKISQLNNQLLNAQYAEYSSSSEYFESTIKKDILSDVEAQYGADSDELNGIKKILKDNHILTMDDLTDYLVGLDETSPDIESGLAGILKEAYKKAGSGTVLTANAYSKELQDFTGYISGLMQKEVDALQQQKDALAEINNQREYEIKLMEAKLNLENAINNKQRVYRAGVGFVYEADQGAIASAQKELKTVEGEKEVSKISKQIEIMQAAVDQWTGIWDLKTEEAKAIEADNFAKTVLGWENGTSEIIEGLFGSSNQMTENLTNGMNSINGNIDGSFDNMNGMLESTLADGYKDVVDATHGVSTSIDQQTVDILTDKEKKAAEARVELAELWENYQQVVKNGGSTAEQNAALANYRNAFGNAVSNGYINANSYAGWTNDTSTASGTESFGGESSYVEGTSTNYKHADHRWVLGTKGAADIGSGLYNLTGTTNVPLNEKGEVAQNILGDMKKGDPNAAWFWTADNWKEGGSAFTTDSGKKYEPIDSDDTLATYAQRMYKDKGVRDMIVVGSRGDNEWAWIHNGQIYALQATSTKDKAKDIATKGVWNETNATGTTDSAGGTALINELGTEAIITPQGTITALPAHSGVVPADITKNLWALGEVAPNILRAMGHYTRDNLALDNNNSTVTDESFNISNLTMNVSADNSFDADAFVASIKSRVALTKNTRR